VLDRSHVLRRIDAKPVWSITCFFIAKNYRHLALTRRLIQAAVRYARKQGAKIIEAYPIIPGHITDPRPELYRGVVSTFAQAGFSVAAQRTRQRPIMRYYAKRKKATSSSRTARKKK
jgi:GNAT superfamily N-acetyltransferase